jgi:hypothetical protein
MASNASEAEATAAKAMGDDTKELTKLTADGATDAELADYFGVPVEALAAHDALIRKSRAQLAGRIRRALLAAAEQKEPTALAWLAKKYLEG